jgi:uncharacterized RmlC-like cupin family protein
MVIGGAIRVGPYDAPVAAGDAVVVPAGSPIQLCNAGDGTATVIVAVSAGFVATTADGTEIGTPPWAV